jgi:hypothetical protein
MRKITRTWENLKETGCPYLLDDVELEIRLALLDYFIMPCVEEFIVCGGARSPGAIVHLRNCKRGLVSLLKESGGVRYQVTLSSFCGCQGKYYRE